jgi:hypothetical protein
VSATITTDDALYLPETDVVQKLTTRYAVFAHEQLIEVEGG